MSTKVCGKCKEVKTLDGFNKSKRDGYQAKCKACKKEHSSKYYAANPEKGRAKSAEYRAANPEKRKEIQAKYCADNPEKRKESQAKWCAANPEKRKEYDAEYRAANLEKLREYQAEYYADHLEKFRARTSKRRAIKLKAIPFWLTQEDYQAMEAIYAEAKRLELETGIKYEVDHIYPLQGKLVCGLHCPSNLQILTKSENRSKSNKFKPYVESES